MKACCQTYLNEQFDGDAGVVCEIYVEYVSSMEEKSSEIERALKARDWTAIDGFAHAVKGNALAVGDPEMASAAIELRGAAKLGDAEGAGAILGRIKGLVAQL